MTPHRVPLPAQEIVWDGRSHARGPLQKSDFFLALSVDEIYLLRLDLASRQSEKTLILSFLLNSRIKLIPSLPAVRFPYFSVVLAPGARTWWQHRGRSKG